VSRLQIFPPIITLYPNDRQLFTAQAVPPPAMWGGITDGGDIGNDFALFVDAAGSQTAGFGAHVLRSGIGILEITVDDQCRPTTTGRLTINGYIVDIAGTGYFYGLHVDASSIEVRDENNTQIYTEAYSTVSGDVYRIEFNAGFRLYRNGVLKHSRVGLGTTVGYPMAYQCAINEPVATDPARVPAPRLIGDWRLGTIQAFNAFFGGLIVWTAPSHGSITTTGPGIQTEYYGGTTPGTYTLTGWIEQASDAGFNQRALATIIIPPLLALGPTAIALQPGQKIRFKTNYDAAQSALIVWSALQGEGSFTQGEYTAGANAKRSIVRATASVNSQVSDIAVTVPVVISNASNYTAAKPSEQIDFDHNIPAIPWYVGAGPKIEGTGNVAPLLPDNRQLNDILLLFVETANETVATPSGWSVMADSPQGTGTAGGAASTRLDVFWKRVVGTEVAPTITDPGDHVIAQILCFRGCIDSGNPWDVTSGDVAAGASTSVSIPGDTTTTANCLVVLAVANATDTAVAQTSGYTNANLANLTELVDVNTTQGNGGGFAVITGEKAAAGAYTTTTATLATSSVQGRISIALKPATITWTASIGSINSSSGIWTAPSLAGQTALIKVSDGTTSKTIEFPVLDVFPLTDPSAPISVDHNKTVLISTSEDNKRTSRIKGGTFQTREVAFRNKQVSELESTITFWDANHPGTRFILDDKIRNKRIVAYFDSNLRWEADASCAIDITFRIREA